MSELATSKMTEAIESLWSRMLGIEARPDTTLVVGRLRPSLMTGYAQISGAWRGAVMVECSCGLSRRVAAILFGADVREISNDQINDALGELTDMIGDNIMALLPEPSQLSMPAVSEGTDSLFHSPGRRPMAQISLLCEGKPFQITVLESQP